MRPEKSIDPRDNTRDPGGSLRILFVATQLPAPQDTGGKIRSYHVLRQLAMRHQVTFIGTVPPGTSEAHLEAIRSICADFVAVPHRSVSSDSLAYRLMVIPNLFSPLPFGIAKDRSPRLATKVADMVRKRKFDLIIGDFLHSMVNLRDLDSVPILLFQHNVEAEILRRHCEQARNPLHRLFWFYQWKKLKAFERRASETATSCVAVSERDRRIFMQDYGFNNVFVIDTGVDVAYFSPSSRPRIPHRMLFTGSMDWRPNEDAMIFFSEQVLPRISRAIPDASLKIVGRYPGKRVQRLAETNPLVQVTGRVDDVRPHLAESSLFIVPLRIGGGTRIKIFEAMASGIPVLSTRIGAEGLPVQDQVHLLLADTPEELAHRALLIMQNPTLAQKLTENAKAFISSNNDWNIIGRQFSDICHQTIQIQKGSINEN